MSSGHPARPPRTGTGRGLDRRPGCMASIRTAVLRANVDTSKREAWYARQLKQGVQVVICHPKLVETGLDLLDFPTRKKLMAGHARVGRKFAGRVSQLITGSTGIDDWEWGVTLVAHQVDALKEIVYEMRFDEVSARYGEFGPFFVNLRLPPAALWSHLNL